MREFSHGVLAVGAPLTTQPPLTSNDYIATLEERAKKQKGVKVAAEVVANSEDSSLPSTKSRKGREKAIQPGDDTDEEAMVINFMHGAPTLKQPKRTTRPNAVDDDNEDHTVKMDIDGGKGNCNKGADVATDEESDDGSSDGDESEDGQSDVGPVGGDVEFEEGEQMVVEVVKPSAKAGGKKARARKMPAKVMLSDFKPGSLGLAAFAKETARMGACIRNPFPNATEVWSDLAAAVAASQDRSFAAALEDFRQDQFARKLLMKYAGNVGYTIGTVRYDIKQHTCNLILSFFGLTSMSHERTLQFMGWLRTDRRYHHGGLDIENRTVNGDAPYQSPVLCQMLVAFMYTSLSKEDAPLLAYLKEANTVPIELLALLTTTLSHILAEHATLHVGSSKQSTLWYSSNNVGREYVSILSMLKDMAQNSPNYMRKVTKNLWYQVQKTTAGTVSKDVYDYIQLEAVVVDMPEYDSEEMQDAEMDGNDEQENEEDPGPVSKKNAGKKGRAIKSK
ncbi:hypothetical protein K435DRAFT_854757 [Dendrothele bispora CBS 962.96]|uniref:DUF6532 domain-containing protein n=1 Tax=Dendrothele bispora (strain CBS 962.96) TaxID=1314807 RepID=A0A4S8MDJ0_DENBC|nr:hypothetical protein K435DRAFT_854757 [Dendrothele bispora CBS 962.96]